jgi:hypothetical protein
MNVKKKNIGRHVDLLITPGEGRGGEGRGGERGEGSIFCT